MPTVRVNDCNLYYEESGERRGTTVLLLHGFPLDHTMWRPQVEALSDEYHLVTPDLRGHGRSEATEGPYTMDLMANDVRQLLESIGVRRIVLGGFSMGGYVAFSYTRLFRKDVQGLVLVDSKMEADTPAVRAKRAELARTVSTEGTRKLVEDMLLKLFTKKTFDTNPELVGRVRKVMESTKPIAVAAALQGMAERPDSTQTLSKLGVPTLVIVGENDGITSVDDARRMAQVSNAELAIIPGTAHLSTLERPTEVTNTMRRFLQRLPVAHTVRPA